MLATSAFQNLIPLLNVYFFAKCRTRDNSLDFPSVRRNKSDRKMMREDARMGPQTADGLSAGRIRTRQAYQGVSM